jgi:hypothetical protein
MTYTNIATLGARLGRGCLILATGVLAMTASASAQTLDVRSFGARCDGSDDSGAVNAAFSALPNGGTLQISCRLGVSHVLLRGKNGVTIEGVSGGGFVGAGSTAERILVRVENCNGCAIQNFSIDANYVGSAGLGIHWSSDTRVENINVVNVSYPAQAGIVAMGNRGNRYLGNSVTNTTGSESDGTRGMWIGNGGSGSSNIEWNALIAHNTMRNIAATGLVGHTAGATLTGNVVDGTRGAGIKITLRAQKAARPRSATTWCATTSSRVCRSTGPNPSW